MDKTERIISELNSIDSSPMLYLANHFDMVRNQIDLDSERYLNSQLLVKDQSQDWYVKLKARSYQRQQEIIEEVGVFQEQCVANLVSKLIDQMNLEAIECGLKNVSLDNQELVLNFQRQLYCELHKRRKTLFLNKGMVYLSGKFCAKAFASQWNRGPYHKKEPKDFSSVSFGCLFLIEDEFSVISIFSDKLKERSR